MAEPLLPPKQDTFVDVVVMDGPERFCMVTGSVAVHPAGSVAVTMYVFAARLMTVAPEYGPGVQAKVYGAPAPPVAATVLAPFAWLQVASV